MTDTILRKADIEKATGLTERTLRIMESEGNFPKRFVLNPSGRAVGWSADEVQDWIAARAATRAAPSIASANFSPAHEGSDALL